MTDHFSIFNPLTIPSSARNNAALSWMIDQRGGIAMFQLRKCHARLHWLLWIVIMGPIVALAQQSTLVGRVTDSSGAAIVGASITAKDVDTGKSWNVSSNDIGQYVIPDLNAGVYEVSAEKQGFEEQTVEGVRLEVQALRTVNLTLVVGVVSQRV